MYKVSIIIPIYNAAHNIEKCINSIINQEYQEYEIICINDGSTDSSEKIIKKYCKKNHKIKLITKENSGVSETRNLGIEKATGDYIMFIDADDYISKNYIKKMIATAKKDKAEIVISGYTEVKNENLKEKTIYNKKEKIFDITFPKEIQNAFSTFEYNPCWKQLIKTDLLLNNNIRFNKNIKYGEDMLFSFKCYISSRKTKYLKDFGYYYFINNESVMNKKDVNALQKYYKDNKLTTEEIFKIYTPSSKEKQALYYKTLKIFNSISWKLISSTENYSNWKYYVKNEKQQYNNIFKEYKINHFGTYRDKISIFLLKYNFYYIYYLLKK